MIKAINLNKTFTQGNRKVEVLKSLELQIKDNETTAILGQSGSGKTTLLSLLCGLDSPDSGEIFLSDTSLQNLSEQELIEFRSQNIGIVFQQFHLLGHLTALENIALPLEILGDKNAYSKSEELLKKVGLANRGDHLPSELSGGECQRVGLARALVTKPKYLFADEPSGSLDEKTGETVMELLFSLVKESSSTLVLVTHNEALAKKCDRSLHLVNGQFQ